jgi:hypothetical protein
MKHPKQYKLDVYLPKEEKTIIRYYFHKSYIEHSCDKKKKLRNGSHYCLDKIMLVRRWYNMYQTDIVSISAKVIWIDNKMECQDIRKVTQSFRSNTINHSSLPFIHFDILQIGSEGDRAFPSQ